MNIIMPNLEHNYAHDKRKQTSCVLRRIRKLSIAENILFQCTEVVKTQTICKGPKNASRKRNVDCFLWKLTHLTLLIF